MLFNSLDYIAFLALTLLGFWALRRFGPERDAIEPDPAHPEDGKRHVFAKHTGLRLAFLFLASCVFYMAWNPTYIALILGSTVLDYVVGLAIAGSERPWRRKAWLLVSLTGNLGLLGVFKYYNFFAGAVGDGLTRLFHVDLHLPVLNVLLPVGISFYTFQTLSYSIDIYRGRLKPTRDFLQFASYVTFFPQLVAGPIVRAAEFLPQIERPPWLTRKRVGEALFLIGLGLAKKIIFADFISVNLVDRVFDDPAAFTSAEVVLGLYGFTLQIYADFSGYTDVARGSGMLFGFDLPENFDRPYQARNVAEFWRRWHMTLSTWLRDYLYFPLGGSRRGPVAHLLQPLADHLPDRPLARRVLDLRHLRKPPGDHGDPQPAHPAVAAAPALVDRRLHLVGAGLAMERVREGGPEARTVRTRAGSTPSGSS